MFPQVPKYLYYFPYNLEGEWGERLENPDPGEASFAPNSTATTSPSPNRTHKIMDHQVTAATPPPP